MFRSISRRSTSAATTNAAADHDPRFLSPAEVIAIVKRAQSHATGGGRSELYVRSEWEGSVRWARNRVHMAADTRSNNLDVRRIIQSVWGSAATNQHDDASLAAAVRMAEAFAHYRRPMANGPVPDYVPTYQYAKTSVWSDATARQTAEEREQMARTLMRTAELKGLQSAGKIGMTVGGTAFSSDGRPDLYCPTTRAECTVTVRDPDARASGWAGLSSYDWQRIDAHTLIARAVEKCVRSRNPVAVEPGRWTVIFEPQATYDFVSQLMIDFSRPAAEIDPRHPFHKPSASGNDSLLGERVTSELVTISHDMTDPDLGVVPFNSAGDPYSSMTLINRGILTDLAYERWYALMELAENDGHSFAWAFRLHGGKTTLDEMIRTTERGLLVTRLSGVVKDPFTQLVTGVTRDGTWLIEHGKISTAVKNFRFVGSPIFFLNNAEQIGEAVPVYTKDAPAVVPPVKSHDFNMVALADAI